MKMLMWTSLFLCGLILQYSNGIEMDNNHDLDFFIFKSFDGPLYDSEYYEPYEPYDISYNNDHNDNDDNSNSSEDVDEADSATDKGTVNDNNTKDVQHFENNASEDNDDNSADDDGDDDDAAATTNKNETENDDENTSEIETFKNVNPDQKELKKNKNYIEPEDVEYRLSRQKRSKKSENKSKDKSNTDNYNYDYNKTYKDFVRKHFGVEKEEPSHNDSNQHNDEYVETENSDEGGETHAGEVDNQSNEEDGSDESGDDSSNEDDVEDADYQRVKKLSEREVEESRRSPNYCQIVYKDDQECTVCKNPKTHDTSESCSYSSAPAPKRYAFKRQKNYSSKGGKGDRNDDDNDDNSSGGNNEDLSSEMYDSKNKHKRDDDQQPKRKYKMKSQSKKSKKIEKSKKKSQKNPVESKIEHYENPHYYNNYDSYNNGNRNTNSPLRNHKLEDYDDDLAFRASEPYVATTSADGSVDKVLESFKNRDWSQCKHKRENGITCYYCKEADGTTQEECMYSSDMDETTTPITKTKIPKPVTRTFALEPKPLTPKPFFVPTQSVYANPTSILTNFNNNNNKINHRQLNRDQNFKMNPILNIKDMQNYNNEKPPPQNQPDSILSPVTTLEYIEPKNKRTLKRMVSYKVHNEADQKDPIQKKSLFYSKVIHGFQ